LIVNIFGTKSHVVTILARREIESLYVFEVITAAKQRRCRRAAERTTAVSVSGVMAAHDTLMVSCSASGVAGFCRLQIYPEYGQLFDMLVAEFQTHSAIVVVPLHCFRTSSTTSIQPCIAQRTTFQPSLLLSTARSAHTARHSRDTCANITLQYHARIVTTCHFVPKILSKSEYIFLDPLCICFF
jgi:hypothetical protein